MGPTLSSLRRGLFKTRFSKQGFDGRSALLWGDRVAARRRRRLHRRLLRLLLHRPLLAEEGPEEGRPLVDLSNFIKLKLRRLRLHVFSMKPTWMKRDVNWYFLKLKLRLRLHMLFLKLSNCQLARWMSTDGTSSNFITHQEFMALLGPLPINLCRKIQCLQSFVYHFWRSHLNKEFCQENIALQYINIKYHLRNIMSKYISYFIGIKCTFK